MNSPYWKGVKEMSKLVSSVVKGVGAGMAVGLAAGVIGGAMMQNNKKIKKNTNKAVHAVEDFLDNVQYMFK